MLRHPISRIVTYAYSLTSGLTVVGAANQTSSFSDGRPRRRPLSVLVTALCNQSVKRQIRSTNPYAIVNLRDRVMANVCHPIEGVSELLFVMCERHIFKVLHAQVHPPCLTRQRQFAHPFKAWSHLPILPLENSGGKVRSIRSRWGR